MTPDNLHPTLEILSGPFGSQVREACGLSTQQVFAQKRFDIARAILLGNKKAGTSAPVTPTWGANVRGLDDQEFTPELRDWNVHAAKVTRQVFDGQDAYGSLAPLLETSGKDDSHWKGLGTPAQRRQWAYRRHEPQIRTLAGAGVTKILLEAGRYLDEGKALARLAEDYGAQEIVWSFEAHNGKVPSLDPRQEPLTFEQARNEIALATRGNIRVGVGINCVSADDCLRALDREPAGTFAAVYPNKAKIGSGEKTARFLALSQQTVRPEADEVEFLQLRDELHTSDRELRELALCALQARARILGICCGGTPDDVRVLRDAMDAAG